MKIMHSCPKKYHTQRTSKKWNHQTLHLGDTVDKYLLILFFASIRPKTFQILQLSK